MGDLRDELDASLLFGSGYVCVVGPPSSGKTTLVLNYLVAREQQKSLPCDEAEPNFCLEYMSARSAPKDLLPSLTMRLLPLARRRRRLDYDCAPLEFGASLIRWLEARPEGAELHLVIDDADCLEYSVEDINLWLSHCLPSQAAKNRTVLLWLISERPLRISNCFRYHFIARPEPQHILQWLRRQFDAEQHLYTEAEAADKPFAETAAQRAPDDTMAVTLSAQAVHQVVLDAFAYYTTHQPMCSSVVGRNVQLLIQRIYQILPPLLLNAATARTTMTDARNTISSTPFAQTTGVSAVGPLATSMGKLNARHFSAAWGQFRDESNDGAKVAAAGVMKDDGAAAKPSQSPLVVALKRLGYSAVLLAFVAFYAGSVPKRKQHQAFGYMGLESSGALTHEARGQSHKAAVLTASAHAFSTKRLQLLYEAVLRMCIPHIDPLEFSPAAEALQYVQCFVAWGLLTPVASQRHRSYHCWMPVSSAQQLAGELSLNLFDLIPS